MTKPPLTTKDATQKGGGGGMTHIISSQVVNHQAPNFQRMPGGHWQTMFGQPMEKSWKNATNLLLNLRANSKVFIHPELKKKIHNTITT